MVEFQPTWKKHARQIGSFPQVKINNIWNYQLEKHQKSWIMNHQLSSIIINHQKSSMHLQKIIKSHQSSCLGGYRRFSCVYPFLTPSTPHLSQHGELLHELLAIGTQHGSLERDIFHRQLMGPSARKVSKKGSLNGTQLGRNQRWCQCMVKF